MSINNWIKHRFGVKANDKLAVPERGRSQALLKSTEEIIKEEIKLKKAVNDTDWARIWNDHSSDQEKSVDPTYHSVNSDIHPDYNKLIHGTDTAHKAIPDAANGISPKMIHKVGDEHFMTKPYFSKENRNVPLAGWGIMTTHKLYHSAGLKHLVEDVGTTAINKKPNKGPVQVTVHKFAKGYENAADLPRGGPSGVATATVPRSMDDTRVAGSTIPMGDLRSNTFKLDSKTSVNLDKKPDDYLETINKEFISKNYRNINNANLLQARQIGLMDFLTGNYDRHGNNLLVKSKKALGEKDLLAIDHDRSFTYLPISSPHEEYEKSAMVRIIGDHAGQQSDKHDQTLSDWWNDNKSNIYHEMNRNLNAIGDHQLRKYVRRNFDQRYQMISEWAESYKDHGKSFFERDISSIISSHPLGYVDEDSIKRIKDTLPPNKSEALNMLFAYMKKPREELKGDQLHAIQKIASEYLTEMPDKDAVRFFSKSDSDQRVKAFKNDVLMDIKRDPKKHKTKIQSLLDVNKDLPDDSKFLNPFWVRHLTQVLSQHDSSIGVA